MPWRASGRGTASAAKEHPQATLKEAEKILKPDGTVSGHEIEIVAGKKHLEMELDAGGAIVNTETEKE